MRAFSEFLTREITSEVKDMESIAYGNTEGDLKAACKQIKNAIMKTLLPSGICQSILRNLKDMYGNDLNRYKFAVRSSATGEDTETMSSAGQMDSFLGIQGLKEIFLAVKKCWASQFGFNAIEYKRRNGQVLNSPMAVVIQEMVTCEVSGVLFTCDPVTNNPTFITITANYGLGETVVSGSVEPDTIMLKRKANGQVEVCDIKVGAKHQKIVMQDSGGTVVVDVPEYSRKESCISKELSERLGRLAVKIEKYYKSPRDIEWGIENDTIYILQSRPVTNAAGETEFEVKHEFDSPLRIEKEYVTTANCAEVMPGAISTLGMDLIFKIFSVAFRKPFAGKGYLDNMMNFNYYSSGMLLFCNQMMLAVVDLMGGHGLGTHESNAQMISVFGRILDDPELLSFARTKIPDVLQPSLMQQIRYYQDLFTQLSGVERIKKELEKYHLKFLKCNTAAETFASLLESCDDFYEVIRKHLDCSGCSAKWNMHLFTVLCRVKKNIDADVYSDFATLLASSSNVESADIPQAMQSLSHQIGKDIDSEKFKAMSTEEAEKWLKSSPSLAGKKFRQFIKRHGHRCLKEFDVRSITWEMDPKTLIKLLQNMAGTCTKKETNEQNDEEKIFSQLNIPLSFFTRCALKFILSYCRKAVRAREATKSASVKAMDYWRKGFRRLAKQMVSEGRISDADLIFFFTLDEIKDLLITRSPSIIARANYRKKLFPIVDGYKFPEIMRGIPKPINDEASMETVEHVSDLSMKGTPVSQGIAKGFARVAISLEEAADLKPGEILITHSTDICWSPYFPILSGVVTEIGGLISHGAVVSREYGLPCIVGLQGATKRFRTGDFVLLDGKKGILKRLPNPEDN